AGKPEKSYSFLVIAYHGHTSPCPYTTLFRSVQSAMPNHAPVVTIPQANVSASAGQVFSASSLFSVSDIDNDVLTYFLYDATAGANSGHFEVNGSAVPEQTVVALSASQIAQTTFVAGTSGSNNDFQVMACDGHD